MIRFEQVTVDARGEVVARVAAGANLVTVDLGGGVLLDLVAVEAGAFWMGTPGGCGYADERPHHRVVVSAFLVGRYPVTQEQWRAIMGPAVCRFVGPQRPVDNVSWNGAREFCRRARERTARSLRLPSEAEWEYACRAGTATPFSCGDSVVTSLANYNGRFAYNLGVLGTYRHATTDVGTYPPNGFGICDMHGNVWEWCADPWHGSYFGAPGDSRVWESGGDTRFGVLRGGSWHDTPDVCRSAVRLRQRRGPGDDFIGFRVAASLADGAR